MFSDSISPIIMIRAIAMRNDKCMSPFNIDKATRRRKMKMKIGIPINDEADIKGKSIWKWPVWKRIQTLSSKKQFHVCKIDIYFPHQNNISKSNTYGDLKQTIDDLL
jgi:hypothetical protein